MDTVSVIFKGRNSISSLIILMMCGGNGLGLDPGFNLGLNL